MAIYTSLAHITLAIGRNNNISMIYGILLLLEVKDASVVRVQLHFSNALAWMSKFYRRFGNSHLQMINWIVVSSMYIFVSLPLFSTHLYLLIQFSPQVQSMQRTRTFHISSSTTDRYLIGFSCYTEYFNMTIGTELGLPSFSSFSFSPSISTCE